MAWIAWVKGLCHRAEVLMIAHRLKIDPKMAAACCMIVWEWADDESVEGGTNVPLLSLKHCADSLTGVPGFGDALVEVGWVVSDENGSRFPNWDRYNGPTAKTRMREASRKANWRKTRDICPANDGTKTGPTEQNRTEQFNTPSPLPPPPGGVGEGVCIDFEGKPVTPEKFSEAILTALGIKNGKGRGTVLIIARRIARSTWTNDQRRELGNQLVAVARDCSTLNSPVGAWLTQAREALDAD